eukprot:COSAG01_NODE_23669_length_806_cov_1.026874_1_plen_184_part_00
MFPIEDGSQPPFNVYGADVDELAADTEWLSRYHVSLQLVSAAWGWNLERGGFCLCLCSRFRLFRNSSPPEFLVLFARSHRGGLTGLHCPILARVLVGGYDDERGHATAACVRACAGEPLDRPEPGQAWTDWDVRLSKMIRSTWLFGVHAEQQRRSLQQLARWIKPGGGLRYGRINLDEVYFME